MGASFRVKKRLIIFLCQNPHFTCVSNYFLSTCEKQEGLYPSKVNSSLASTQRPGHYAHYSFLERFSIECRKKSNSRLALVLLYFAL